MRRKEWEVLGFDRLNKHPEKALRLVVKSKSDVFVNLPTGFLESLWYSGFIRRPCFVYCVFLCGTNKLEPKKPDALVGYSMCTCTAALFLP